MTNKMKIALFITLGIIALLAIVAFICIWHFVGFSSCVGEKRYTYTKKEMHTAYADIDLYGVALIPKSDDEEKFPTVIYAHGADSDYKSDMTVLESLAKSGVACYTFDFYGWTKRSTGPEGVEWFKGAPRGVDNAYEEQVIRQTQDLNAVIEYVKTLDFVDTDNIFLIGSSMGGATVAAASVTHSEDIRGIVLLYPAINLVIGAMEDGSDYDVNNYSGDVMILQGDSDVIVPLEMSEKLLSHYNKYNHHAQMIVYEGQPHVFTGKYKVEAAREILNFIMRY